MKHFPHARLVHRQNRPGSASFGHRIAILALGLIALVTAPVVVADDTAEIEKRLAETARYLASDELEGRGIGTRGLDRAAEYIAAQFAAAGLKTDRFDGTPFQKFRVTTAARLGPNNRLAFVGPSSEEGGEPRRIDLKQGEDFSPLAMSGSGTFDLPLAFVGYGITAKEAGYDDYAGIEVAGKAVIVLRHEPQQDDPDSAFNGTKDSLHAPLRRKVSNAFQHGAAAVIFVTDDHEIRANLGRLRQQRQKTAERLAQEQAEFEKLENLTPQQREAHRKRIDELSRTLERLANRLREAQDPVLPFSYGERDAARRDFPVVHCRRAVLDWVLRAAVGIDLATLERQIDQGPAPQSRVLEGWRVVGQVSVERTESEVKNVVAVLEGRGPLAEEHVVIGAHYDHLGWGGPASLEPNQEAIHNGADDNASGVAVLVEIARALAQRPEKTRRSVVFVAFTGEESGLYGSSHYVENPLLPLDRAVAMINFDMVGRLRDDKLIVSGAGTAKPFADLLDRLNQRHGFQLTKTPSGFGPSDQTLFYAKKVPVLHFFTGTHEDYHRPSDDFEKLNLAGMRRIAAFVTDIAVELAEGQQRPEYVALPPPVRSGGQRPYFGSIPDFAYNGPGYAMSGVTNGGPAERAGLRGGDVIVQFGESKIGNLEDFDSALRKYEGGDRVRVVVLRDGQERIFEVTLEPPR